MRSESDLLAETRSRVGRWTGWRLCRTYEDEHGAYAFSVRKDSTTFLCVCKRSLHDNLASFMAKVVDRARSEGYVLVEFVGDNPGPGSAYAFHPETVYHNATPSEGNSAKGVKTDWLELSVSEFGVLLGDYTSGRESLVPISKPPENQATLEIRP